MNNQITDKIEDLQMLDALQKAVKFEDVQAKQTTCYTCLEKYEMGDDIDRAAIPDTWQCSKGHTVESIGWEWADVAADWHVVHKLVKAGFAAIHRKSNKHTEYRLNDREYVRKLVVSDTKPLQSQTKPSKLFSSIVGYDDVKALLTNVIESDKVLHVLLVGPPASAKTIFQLEIERLPNAYFMIGSNATNAGITSLLFNHDVRYLIIDEIEDMKSEDAAVLLTIMESQRIVETKYGRTRSKNLHLSVFASCNSTAKIRKALMSRFFVMNFKQYTYAEFIAVAQHILPVPKEFAANIAVMVWHKLGSRDVRDVIKVYKLLPANTEKDLQWVISILTKYH